MRDFFLTNGPTLVWAITALHLLFTILAFSRFGRTKEPLYLLIGCVAFGLFYDALVQALGGALGEGSLLAWLSRFRFVFHGALIPLLFPICAYGLNYLVTEKMAGILRYKSGDGTPDWARGVSYLLAFGTIIPVILAGIAAWIRQKTPLLLLAGVLMFAFAALGPATGNMDLNFLITMIGEMFLALFFLLYARRKAALHK